MSWPSAVFKCWMDVLIPAHDWGVGVAKYRKMEQKPLRLNLAGRMWKEGVRQPVDERNACAQGLGEALQGAALCRQRT